MARHTFHNHLIATYINKVTILCVPLPIVDVAAFSVACFWGLSDIHKRLGGLHISLVCLDGKLSGWKSTHNSLVRLSSDLAKSKAQESLSWDYLAEFNLCRSEILPLDGSLPSTPM